MTASPQNPWINQPRYKDVDQLLASVISESYAFRDHGHGYAKHYTGIHATAALDVSYTSYKAMNRQDTRATARNPNHFIFLYDDRIARRRWQTVANDELVSSGMACRLSKDAGFRRSMCLRIDAQCCTAPAMMCDPDGSRDVNGILYVAPKAWLQDGKVPDAKHGADMLLAAGMERVELNPAHFTMLNSYMMIPPGVMVYAYVVSDPKQPTFDYPIRQSILDSILGGCLEHSVGDDFAAEWVDTTDGWELSDGMCYWLNDRYIARRPWIGLGGKYKIYDRLVYESTSRCVPLGVLLKRRLPEEYAMLSVSENTGPAVAIGCCGAGIAAVRAAAFFMCDDQESDPLNMSCSLSLDEVGHSADAVNVKFRTSIDEVCHS